MIQAQTSGSEAHSMMVFKEIDLINIRQFDHKKLVFKPGFNLFPMGPSQGKSTLIESIRSVFLISSSVPTGFFRDNSASSSVKLALEINQEKMTISKKWSDRTLTEHIVTSDAGETLFDLTVSEQTQRWFIFFLERLDKIFPTEAPVAPDVLGRRYDLIGDLALAWFDVKMILHRHWLYSFLNVDSYDYILEELLKAQDITAGRLDELKTFRQTASRYQGIMERFAEELKQTDQEIDRINAVIQQWTKNAEGDEGELRQQKKINEFIETKKNEINKIDFELRSYKSLLKNNIANEFSEDEIADIEKKKKTYEQIILRLESLQKKLVERGHLEKNLTGILNEITQFKITQTGSEFSTGNASTEIYESEVRRIRNMLKSFSGLDLELETADKEKHLYQSSHDQYLVITKLKQLVAQNEQKQIRSVIEKLELDREGIVKELEQMQSTTHAERYRNLLSRVQQVRQQILEQNNKLETLYEKRLQILRSYKENINSETDLSGLERNIRQQVNVKKFLSLMAETSQFVQNDLIDIRRKTFLNYVRNYSSEMPEPMVLLADRFLSLNDDEPAKTTVQRYSHSEMTEFSMMFRMLCLSYLGYKGVIVLDEHHRWIMETVHIDKVNDLVKRLSFEQSIAFDKS